LNKKTIELAKEAGFVFWEDDETKANSIDWSCDYNIELNKLVELVVQECAKSVEHIKVWDTNLGNVIVDNFFKECHGCRI